MSNDPRVELTEAQKTYLIMLGYEHYPCRWLELSNRLEDIINPHLSAHWQQDGQGVADDEILHLVAELK